MTLELKVATITLRRDAAAVHGVPRTVISSALTAFYHASQTDCGQVCIQRRSEVFGELQPDGAILVPVGLVPRLRPILLRQGYEVDVDRTVPWLPLLDARKGIRDRGETASPRQRAFLRHHQGQVAVSSLRQATQVIGDVALLYPTTNILVVAKNNHDVRQIAGRLRDLQLTLYVGVETALSPPVGKTYSIAACRHMMHYLLRFLAASSPSMRSS